MSFIQELVENQSELQHSPVSAGCVRSSLYSVQLQETRSTHTQMEASQWCKLRNWSMIQKRPPAKSGGGNSNESFRFGILLFYTIRNSVTVFSQKELENSSLKVSLWGRFRWFGSFLKAGGIIIKKKPQRRLKNCWEKKIRKCFFFFSFLRCDLWPDAWWENNSESIRFHYGGVLFQTRLTAYNYCLNAIRHSVFTFLHPSHINRSSLTHTEWVRGWGQCSRQAEVSCQLWSGSGGQVPIRGIVQVTGLTHSHKHIMSCPV